MAHLQLCFESSVLKEYSLGTEPLTIGRSPQSSICIDNPAVSFSHARVLYHEGAYYVQDLNSFNGTFVNGSRVTQTLLRPGDVIAVGKHSIRFSIEHPGRSAPGVPAAPSASADFPLEKLEGTMILDTKTRRALHEKAGSSEAVAKAPAAKRMGQLTVVKGKTTAKEYVLASQTSMIGKAEGCGVRLKGWFAPKVAAIIIKTGESYFLSPAGKKTYINGQPTKGRHELKDGDSITVGRVEIRFTLVPW